MVETYNAFGIETLRGVLWSSIRAVTSLRQGDLGEADGCLDTSLDTIDGTPGVFRNGSAGLRRPRG
ncbi:MAG: hypothetical protein D6806_15630 [Deltaproteobacteria bacterium]|nr:MAG: hypothetical protein D6806_15630 [Deltaproteobacteria bacterium]